MSTALCTRRIRQRKRPESPRFSLQFVTRQFFLPTLNLPPLTRDISYPRDTVPHLLLWSRIQAMAEEDEVPNLTPDPAVLSKIDAFPRRRATLVAVRWVLIGICVYLISDNPRSAAVLGPLLLLAIFLGRSRRRAAARAAANAPLHDRSQ